MAIYLLYFEWYIRKRSGVFVKDCHLILSGRDCRLCIPGGGGVGGGGGSPGGGVFRKLGFLGFLKTEKMAFLTLFWIRKTSFCSWQLRIFGENLQGLGSKTIRNEIGKNDHFSKKCQKVRKGCCTFGVFFALQPLCPF